MACVVTLGLVCLTGAFTATLDVNPSLRSATATLPDGARVLVVQTVGDLRLLDLSSMPTVGEGQTVHYWKHCTALRCRFSLAAAGRPGVTVVDIEPLPGGDFDAVARTIRLQAPVTGDLSLAALTQRQADSALPLQR